MLTPEKIDEVIDAYKRLKSPFRVAKLLNLDVQQVWDVIEENPERLAAIPTRFGGEGRPDMSPYLAARRKVSDGAWDNDSAEIVQARFDYEAGTHDMATGRDGNWLLMYMIPRVRITPRPDYFRPVAY
jgi:hypothetical protein